MMMGKGRKPNYRDMEKALAAASTSRSRNYQLFEEEDDGPQYHQPPNNLVTKPINAKNLSKVFENLPIHGCPEAGTSLRRFRKTQLKDYLGGVCDKDFKIVRKRCNGGHLTCGKEVSVMAGVEDPLLMNVHSAPINPTATTAPLTIHDKHRGRDEDGDSEYFQNNLKYHNIHLSPLELQALSLNDNKPNTVSDESITMKGCKKKNKKSGKAKKKLGKSPQASTSTASGSEPTFHHGTIPKNLGNPVKARDNNMLKPGDDILIKVRIYRRFDYELYKNNPSMGFNNLFYHDMILTGQNKMADIREKFTCSEVQAGCKATAKNGFFYFNNAFYLDNNELEPPAHASLLRNWTTSRKLAVHNMHTVRLDDLKYKLGNPEVYFHGDTCEHIIVFSDIRLVNANDPLYLSDYPLVSAIAQSQSSAFCYNCADFNPKWIVSGCARLPYNMALFCQKCLQMVLHNGEGKKICKFKAYPYKEANPPKD